MELEEKLATNTSTITPAPEIDAKEKIKQFFSQNNDHHNDNAKQALALRKCACESFFYLVIEYNEEPTLNAIKLTRAKFFGLYYSIIPASYQVDKSVFGKCLTQFVKLIYEKNLKELGTANLITINIYICTCQPIAL